MSECTITPEVFEILIANRRELAEAVMNGKSLEAASMSTLNEAAAEKVSKTHRYYDHGDHELRYHTVTVAARDVHTVKDAFREIKQLTEFIDRAQQDIDNARQLIDYYANMFAILNSCTVHRVYYLDRYVNEYTDKKVTYRIFAGEYNEQLKHFTMQCDVIEEFTGKDHRLAAERIAAIVKADNGTRGYRINNGYKSSLVYDKPDFT